MPSADAARRTRVPSHTAWAPWPPRRCWHDNVAPFNDLSTPRSGGRCEPRSTGIPKISPSASLPPSYPSPPGGPAVPCLPRQGGQGGGGGAAAGAQQAAGGGAAGGGCGSGRARVAVCRAFGVGWQLGRSRLPQGPTAPAAGCRGAMVRERTRGALAERGAGSRFNTSE